MQPLSDVYPVNSVVSMTLVTDEVVEGKRKSAKGRIYLFVCHFFTGFVIN